MKVIRIENSYKDWDYRMMWCKITLECYKQFQMCRADRVLHRSYIGMYIEWYLHNIGYWLTLPFIKNEKIKTLNERFKHVDLEEHASDSKRA